jgi:hypothetical protein
MTLVHVALLGEGTSVWRPVQARHVQDSVYELTGVVPDGEEWEFQPGQFVECVPQDFSGGRQGLVANRPVPPNKSFKPKPLRGSA